MVVGYSHCYLCLCDCCSNVKSCPAGRKWFKSKCAWCLRCLDVGSCPRIKCDFFVPEYRKHYYKINKQIRREDQIVDQLRRQQDQLDALQKVLDNLVGKL